VEVDNEIMSSFLHPGIVYVNSDSMEQDAGEQNFDYAVGVLERFGHRLRVPGFIVSGPIFTIAN
jgi:hypothetical protein